MDRKRIPAISIESQEIIRRLEKCAVGEIVGYDELSQLAMGDVQKEKRFTLTTAKKHMLQEKHWVFEVVVNIGIQRLVDADILKLREIATMKTHHTARRTRQKLSCVNYDGLTRNQQIEHNAGMSLLGVLDHITKPKQIKQIEAAVAKSQSRLQLQETLDAFDRKGADEQ